MLPLTQPAPHPLPTRKVKFKAKVEFEGGGHVDQARVFQEGETYDLPADQAAKWVVRRLAEYVAEAPPAPGGKADKDTQALRERLASEQAVAPVVAAPVVEMPKLSAAEERAAREQAPVVQNPEAEQAGENAGIDPLSSKNAGKAVVAPPRDKTVKPASTHKK